MFMVMKKHATLCYSDVFELVGRGRGYIRLWIHRQHLLWGYTTNVSMGFKKNTGHYQPYPLKCIVKCVV